MRSFVVPTAAAVIALAWAQAAAGQSFEALADQAAAALDADRLGEAAALYRGALAQRPDWAEGWWKLGTALYDADDYAGAADAFRKATAKAPQSGVSWVMLGLSEAKLGSARDALEHIARGRSLGGGEQDGIRRVMLYTQGSLLLGEGKFGQAQEVLDALAADGADQDEALVALGCSVLGLMPSRLSGGAAERDLVLRAGRAEYFAARRDEYQRARSEYERLAADYPKTPNVQFALGRYLLANHQDDDAVKAFERELQVSPDHVLARLGIAGIKAGADPRGGLPYAREALRLAPQLAEAHFLVGLLLLNCGRPNEAVPELEEAQRRDSADARVYFQLGRAYAALDRKEDAARARAQFARLNDSNKP